MERIPKSLPPPPSHDPSKSPTASNIRTADAVARSNLYYVLAIISISAIGAVSVLMVLYLHPDADNTQLIVTIFGFLTPTLLFLFTLVRQIENGVKVEENRIQSIETHKEVNSRMSEMKDIIEQWAFEQGRKAGLSQRLTEGQTSHVGPVVPVLPVVPALPGPPGPPGPPGKQGEQGEQGERGKSGDQTKSRGTTITPVVKDGEPLMLPATVVIAEAKPEEKESE